MIFSNDPPGRSVRPMLRANKVSPAINNLLVLRQPRKRKARRTCDGAERQGSRFWRGVQHCAFAAESRSDMGGQRHRPAPPHSRRREHGRTLTPNGVGLECAMIEASRLDPAAAYVAVDRHRLDDLSPYIYRTRDYGKTWRPDRGGSCRTPVLPRPGRPSARARHPAPNRPRSLDLGLGCHKARLSGPGGHKAHSFAPPRD